MSWCVHFQCIDNPQFGNPAIVADLNLFLKLQTEADVSESVEEEEQAKIQASKQKEEEKLTGAACQEAEGESSEDSDQVALTRSLSFHEPGLKVPVPRGLRTHLDFLISSFCSLQLAPHLAFGFHVSRKKELQNQYSKTELIHLIACEAHNVYIMRIKLQNIAKLLPEFVLQVFKQLHHK